MPHAHHRLTVAKTIILFSPVWVLSWSVLIGVGAGTGAGLVTGAIGMIVGVVMIIVSSAHKGSRGEGSRETLSFQPGLDGIIEAIVISLVGFMYIEPVVLWQLF